MSLRFFFGPSGAGKSRQLYQEIMEKSLAEPDKSFLIIVPDQFTMQTQKDFVMLHDRGGILNIDVLSFGRLTHRIFDEVGEVKTPVLDDTGKSLILQKVALSMLDELPALGSHLHMQGYIHEVKSAISEFMQYGIMPSDMPELIEYASKRGALSYKLKDLMTLYQGFLDYITGQFITTEETLGLLCRSLEKSRLIKDSVVVFDGFTGFTPVQNQVIQEIMRLSKETIVSLTLGRGEDPYRLEGEQKLFYLTQKTVHQLETLAREIKAERGADVFVTADSKDRFAFSPALRALEANLFRYDHKVFEQDQSQVHLMEAVTPKEEVHFTGLKILELIRTGDMAYRDMALIVGDMDSYAPYVETEFAKMGIPCYIDRTHAVLLNPMIEFINSVLELYLNDFSYEAVFHYLRSGLSDITAQETDELENYILSTGIRGYRKWSRLFTHRTKDMEEDQESLLRINRIRERFIEQICSIRGKSTDTVEAYVNDLYQFMVDNCVQEKLVKLEKMFTQQGDLTRAREYAQIYRMVMDLLNQIYELLGKETIRLQEFADILEAGFGEIQVGTIPQNVDRILVGDMERTRLKQVKVLFFLGVNDGNIPKNSSKGGILSDMDREFLRESNIELAPTPRQQMFIQRFYLYLNLTKPSHELYLSYCKVSSQGKTLRPAYLVDVIQKIFPSLKTEYSWMKSRLECVVTPKEGIGYLAEGLRAYVQGMQSEAEERDLFTLYAAYGEQEEYVQSRDQLTEAAFERYRERGLSQRVARALYGITLENSVSRLETYAACAYQHFLKYGLSIQERKEFGFERVDMGNVFHTVLEKFARCLSDSPYTWFDFPKEFGENQVNEILHQYAAEYGETILYSSARNEYAITRMARILARTVFTLQEQLRHGDFTPDAYEMSFQYADHLDSIHIMLSEEEKMKLRGRIDRIDTLQEDDKVYVKVIDYKSGDQQFDLTALYYGLQLQLVIYMNAAMEIEAKKHPDKEIVPAALLYYHIEDPTVEASEELSEEELNSRILEQLRMKGVVSKEAGIAEKLDKVMGSKSMVIPVEKKKDGDFSARSSVLSDQELKLVSDYVNDKVKSIGREIMDGVTALNPYERGNSQACTYCIYRKVCGFDPAIPGYEKRVLNEMSPEEALMNMEARVWQ